MTLRPLLVVVCLLAFGGVMAITASAGAIQPAQSEKADPSKDSKDIDQTIAFPMAQVLDAAKQALATYGCDIKKETADTLECTRDRHIGAFVGSGGEKITVHLSEKGKETRVEVKTGKGFVGRLGKKNWSTPVFEDMLATLKGR